ncbi:hypothetical protein FB464_1761 [Subtercola boreus]|nr:hypothetical protein FB464_1761 [Subtercola boreus]
MGESLYGDPSLALRELYQNALDACRLAVARLTYLQLEPEVCSPARPRIEVVQGFSDDGRAFVDCIDRGAGMGVEELSLAFCQAGVRASDLVDRSAEAADFAAADPPVELWLNSRFGIGVMSYFMIAEHVDVSTARLNRDGSIGRLLTLHIPGPAEEFEIVDHGLAESHGTRVRLWLKPGSQVSAVSTLRDLVFVCPFTLHASDKRGLEHRWIPHELNRASTSQPGADFSSAVPGVPGRLWWIAGIGTVLADGIWAQGWLHGMVVSLEGTTRPQLTADRTKIVRMDHNAIESLAVAAAASAVDEAWAIVGTPGWLGAATQHQHRVADAVIELAADRGLGIRLPSGSVPLSVTGYLAGDEDTSAGLASRSVLAWRFSRLAAGGHYLGIGVPRGSAEVLPARPSDAILLGVMHYTYRHGTGLETSDWFGDATSIYEAERHLEIPLRDVVSRARRLGLTVPPGADGLPDTTEMVRTALSFSRRQRKNDTFRPLGLFDIVQTSWEHGVMPSEVVAELEAHSIAVDPSVHSMLEKTLEAAHLIAASTQFNGVAPWLCASDVVGLSHVLRVAGVTGQACSEVVRCLRELGFSDLPAFRLDGVEPSADDVRMLSVDLDGRTPFIDAAQPVRHSHLVKAAKELKVLQNVLEERFAQFGVTFLAPAEEPRDLGRLSKKELFSHLGLTGARRDLVLPRHLEIMSLDADGRAPWLNPAERIPAWTVASFALSQNRTLDAVIADCLWLGYTVEDPRTVERVRVPGPEHALR